jgi:signal peptidase I
MSTHAAAPGSLVRVLLRAGTRLLALTLAALVLGALVVVAVLPRATGGVAMTVLTGSMSPEIPAGSIVLVRPVEPGTLEVGDVATYQAEEGKAVFITHRITAIDTSTSPATYTFKGDANRGADLDPVVPDQVRGEVWFHVPHLGTVRDALHGGTGVTLAAAVLLGGYALSQLAAGVRERRRQPEETDAPWGVDRVLP